MTLTDHRQDSGLGVTLGCSLALHLAFFCVAGMFPGLFRVQLQQAPTYYVDLVNLPVADPRAGAPSRAIGVETAKESPQTLPAAVPPATAPAQTKAAPVPATRETPKEFTERLDKLRQSVDANHANSAMEAMRRRLEASRNGIPGGRGSEQGSDFANFIQSRLTDAFRETISYQSRNPQVFVRITIDSGGQVIRCRFERSSGDSVFETSVRKAIAQAEKSFRPPPDGQPFEHLFCFKPQGVGAK